MDASYHRMGSQLGNSEDSSPQQKSFERIDLHLFLEPLAVQTFIVLQQNFGRLALLAEQSLLSSGWDPGILNLLVALQHHLFLQSLGPL